MYYWGLGLPVKTVVAWHCGGSSVGRCRGAVTLPEAGRLEDIRERGVCREIGRDRARTL